MRILITHVGNLSYDLRNYTASDKDFLHPELIAIDNLAGTIELRGK